LGIGGVVIEFDVFSNIELIISDAEKGDLIVFQRGVSVPLFGVVETLETLGGAAAFRDSASRLTLLVLLVDSEPGSGEPGKFGVVLIDGRLLEDCDESGVAVSRSFPPALRSLMGGRWLSNWLAEYEI
jgi:hypothetical protein